MPKRAKELSALEVGRLTEPGNHPVGGIPGLYLYVNEGDGKSWILRTMVGTRRRHIGLGGFPAVTLAQAREKARRARDEVEVGVDPVEKRRNAAIALRAEQAQHTSFEEATARFLLSQGDVWKNSKHRAQWQSTIETYAFPTIGKLEVREISHHHLLRVLEPIWRTKTETASRLRGRIERILDWAAVHGLREGANPARWKGHFDKLLPAPAKVQKVVHHRALALGSVPSFMKALALRDGVSARALEFCILTAARSGEVRGACWKEIDLVSGLWTVPAERMKAGQEHRVPLSEPALKLLRKISPISGDSLLFPGSKGQQLSDMSLSAVLKRMNVDAVPHGFRSTFRDWVGEMTNFPRELAEQALAHTLDNKVEAAYRRGDAVEKRRTMMTSWATFCY